MNKPAKSYWPYGIICFFLVLFGFNGWFAYQATQSNKGAVEEDTYQKSLHYQDVIDLKTSSKKLGWKVKYTYQSGSLRVVIKNTAGEILENLQVKAELILLSGKGAGFQQELLMAEEEYQAKVSLKQGLWQIKLYAENDSEKFYDEYQLLTS